MGDAAQAVADTRRWLERAVVGLNLCPFAKAVHANGAAVRASGEAIEVEPAAAADVAAQPAA